MLLEMVSELPKDQVARFIDFFLFSPDKKVRTAAVAVIKNQPDRLGVTEIMIKKLAQV